MQLSHRRAWSAGVLILTIGWLIGWFSHTGMDSKAVYPPINLSEQSAALSPEPLPVLKTGKSTVANKPVALNPDPLQIFRGLLMQEWFSEALSAWPQHHAEQARRSVFALAKRLNQDSMTATAMLLLSEYRNRFSDDIEAGLLHAKLLHQMQLFEQEVFLLIGLLNKTVDSNSLSYMHSRLDKAVRLHRNNLMQAQAYSLILSFYRNLSNLDGANQDYQLMQAMALMEMGQLQQASTLLEPLVFDDEAGHRAKTMLQEIEAISDAEYQVSIPLQRSGDHFLVPLSINGQQPVQLILDTGASITLVQRDQASFSGSNKLPTITLQTANGRMDVPLMKSSRASLGPFQLKNVDIALINRPVAANAKGLLGMNILKRFNFFIDQQAPALHLTLRSLQESGK